MLEIQESARRQIGTVAQVAAGIQVPRLDAITQLQASLAAQQATISRFSDIARALYATQDMVSSRMLAQASAASATDILRQYALRVGEVGARLRGIWAMSTSSAQASLALARTIQKHTCSVGVIAQHFTSLQPALRVNAINDAQSVLSERMRSISRMPTATKLVADEIQGSVQAALAARDALSSHISGLIDIERRTREGLASHAPALMSIKARLDALRVSTLVRFADELTERDAVFAELGEEDAFTAVAETLHSEVLDNEEFARSSIEAQINYLVEWTQRQDNDRRRLFMVNLICNLLASVIWWSAMTVVTDTLSYDSSVPSQQVVRNVHDAIDEEVTNLVNVRIVKRSVFVRTSRRRRAVVVCRLEVGSVVQLVQKVGKWSQVEWMDGVTGEMKIGWVRSKYMLRIDK